MMLGIRSGAEPSSLSEGALAVLRLNDLGGWTKPAPRLYPHQWSWDSAFIAIGLAGVDPGRALRELETLFAAQWADGRVPHIVFNPEAADYFPGPDWWATSELAHGAPDAPRTSGLVQPPVHALAVRLIFEVCRGTGAVAGERFSVLYERLLAWHRYLALARDPEGSGLLSIYHPWEGTDNSPRWDDALARLQVGELPAYQRHDLKHVADPAERPTQAEYDRFLWLVELLKAARYDDATIRREHPFLIKDVQLSAIFAAANEALAQLAEALGRPARERAEILAWQWRSSEAVQQCWDSDAELALDLDERTGQPIRVRTSAGLTPILAPGLDPALAERVRRRLVGHEFAGAPGLAFFVVPSTAPGSRGFNARAYWRGPSWPVMDWLLGWGLRKQGFAEDADRLKRANLALLSRPGAHFAEYFEPYTGEPLGSRDQSWTAAVVLEWLAEQPSA